MSRLRLVLVLFLSVALDLSVPVPSQAQAHEVVEEFEEASRARRARRLVRDVRDTTAPAMARETAVGERRPPAPPPVEPARPVATGVRAQKIPPLAAASPSAPEDH